MARRLILIVDDDPVMRNSLARYLAKRGFDVKTVGDGFEVLLLLEYLHPDLIITDIRMPKLDGLTLLQGLKNREPTSKIPVIFMSGCSTDEILQKAKELGALFFLFKPFPLNYLDEVIEEILGQECEEYVISCQGRTV